MFTPLFMRFWFLEYFEDFSLPDDPRYARVSRWVEACLAHPAAQQVTKEQIVKLYYDYCKGAGNAALLPGRKKSSFVPRARLARAPWPPRNKYEHLASDAELADWPEPQARRRAPARKEKPMQITVETTVNAPVAEVWRAYTTPEDIKQWNAASPDWHTTKATVDLREGGAFSSRMEAKDGSMGFDFAGTYTRIVPHERIEYAFGDRTARGRLRPRRGRRGR